MISGQEGSSQGKSRSCEINCWSLVLIIGPPQGAGGGSRSMILLDRKIIGRGFYRVARMIIGTFR
jgi:hypothetical protein